MITPVEGKLNDGITWLLYWDIKVLPNTVIPESIRME